jgi:hypothetical protein
MISGKLQHISRSMSDLKSFNFPLANFFKPAKTRKKLTGLQMRIMAASCFKNLDKSMPNPTTEILPP